MPYTHGVYVNENPTSVTVPIESDSAVQVIIGTAPINLADNPSGAINKPIPVYSFSEASKQVGYSNSFNKFTLCQSVDVSFRVFNVAPLILINVLDPTKHKLAVVEESHALVDNQLVIEEEGVMLDENFIVKSTDGITTYNKDTDYTVEFNDNGYPLVKRIADGTIASGTASLNISYTQLDPTAVTKEDIIAGIEFVNEVYPRYNIVPGLLLAPGWSHLPEVGMALTSKTEGLNGVFKCNTVKDIDTTVVTAYTDAIAWKNQNSYTNIHDFVCWPMCVIGEKKYYFSALEAARIAQTDAENENVPYVSPSNKDLRISGTVLADGTEVFLDQTQSNYLNGGGIITALNMNGWKSWGNNTGVYPGSTDIKDRFIPVRRMFDWWGNTFILTYFQKVDDPMNKRLIESVVDSENIRANGFKARFQIADARIEFNADENPTTDLLDGSIRFKQYLTPYPPAKTIINVLEFDPSAFTASLT